MNFVEQNWHTVRGFYVMVKEGYDSPQGHLFARTKCPHTAERLRSLGYLSCSLAWKLYRRRLTDFTLYGAT